MLRLCQDGVPVRFTTHIVVMGPGLRRDDDGAASRGQPIHVIASEAKQSMLPRKERMDCFVALLLAMTARKGRSRKQSIRPQLRLDHVGGLLADHDGRC